MSIQAGANATIVSTLKQYGSVSVDFLASVLNRGPEEVAEYCRDLESRGVVKFQGGEVQLMPETASTSSGGTTSGTARARGSA